MKRKYRKKTVTITACLGMLLLTGCGRTGKYDIKIVVPAGSQDRYVYAEEEISPEKDRIIIYAGKGLGDTEVVLKAADTGGDTVSYGPFYLTPGMPVKIEVPREKWFRPGVSVQNPGDEDMEVYITVKDAELRIR